MGSHFALRLRRLQPVGPRQARGYNAKVAAENVGTGQASIDEALKGWKESAAHNKNLLLPDVEHIGIALVSDPKTEFKTFWTLVLASGG